MFFFFNFNSRNINSCLKKCEFFILATRTPIMSAHYNIYDYILIWVASITLIKSQNYTIKSHAKIRFISGSIIFHISNLYGTFFSIPFFFSSFSLLGFYFHCIFAPHCTPILSPFLPHQSTAVSSLSLAL